MSSNRATIVLENGLDLNQVITTGSVLNINEDYDEKDVELEQPEVQCVDLIGGLVQNIEELQVKMEPVDLDGFVMKKVLEEGGGMPLEKTNTVSVAYSAYWEKDSEPFDMVTTHRPLVVDLNDNGLLPGLLMAIESMLVGEKSVFVLSYQVMYGELGIPPRIKPKAVCVFYIKLVKSIITSAKKIVFSEPNMFDLVYHEVKMLYSSGLTLNKANNCSAAIQLFRKAVFMLHKCRLANEEEEKRQEKLLVKLYTNLAICYNKVKLPLKSCTACNELNRLGKFWNNSKLLYQNAKSLRMIGEYDAAKKRVVRAIKLNPDNAELQKEFDLIEKTREICNQKKLIIQRLEELSPGSVSAEFKNEVDSLINNFKENVNLCKLTLPPGLSSSEVNYIRDACIKQNLFFNKIEKSFALDKDNNISRSCENALSNHNQNSIVDLLEL